MSEENKQPKIKKSFFQRRIPTLVGIGVLLLGLVAGTIIFSQGTGVFSPRATPETTPKKIRVSNVTDSGFTVSFLTDEETVGFIKYGTAANKLGTQASDDRDQLSGTVGEYQTHHVTVRGLDANTQYFYTLGTGSGSFDNEGSPFQVKTAQRNGVPSAAKTIYGSVVTSQGNPAEGSLVYVKTAAMGEMSSLVKSSGSWAIPLSNARTVDGSGYAQVTDDDVITLTVQGPSANLVSQSTVVVSNAQPVANLTLGETLNTQAAANPSPVPSPSPTPEASASATASPSPSPSPSTSGNLTNLTVNNEVLDLDEDFVATSSPEIESGTPKIVGMAKPNVTVSIQVHSETNIDQYVVADANGEFSLDLAALGEELEPGEHTVTYSYEDPDTGKTVTKTQTFYVSDPDAQLAMADTSPSPSPSTQPFSSGNPYPADDDASDSAEATDSGRVSNVATDSSLPVSGSVGTTMALIMGGLFFILAGVWSWWIANNLEEELAL